MTSLRSRFWRARAQGSERIKIPLSAPGQEAAKVGSDMLAR
jgi:hypothetical protein